MNLEELNVKKAKELFDSGDKFLLEYLEKFIPSELAELYIDTVNYNSIYGNGLTINDLIKMGKDDKYCKRYAETFIEEYGIDYKDYNTDFSDKYFELRDKLLDKLGLLYYLTDTKELDECGFDERETITEMDKLDEQNSFTIARVMNYNHCIELHYDRGKSWVEYSTKTWYTSWQTEWFNADWFRKNMSDDEVMDKLVELFDEYKANDYNTAYLAQEEYSFM